MGKGYLGKILIVDLASGKTEEEVIPDHIYEKFLSGSGLGAHILNDKIPTGADPLGPENIIGFVSGLLTGTGSLFTGRWMAISKSPLTGGWGEANCGGNFAPAVKRCGYDGIFIKGVSKKPVYLFIRKGKAELLDANYLWGKDCIDTEDILIREHSDSGKLRVACIGPAGEKLSLISGISNDRGRMAARSGLGAVMGSKKLKAVVLDGVKKIKTNNRHQINSLSRQCNKWVQFQPPFLSGGATRSLGTLMRLLPTQASMDGMLWKIMLRKWGTVSINQLAVETGDAPIKNWKGSNRDFNSKHSKEINPDAILERETTKYHCYSCPLGCGGICRGDFPSGESHKPEYETVLSLSGLCMNEDLESVFYLNDLLNRAGMDTISAGSTVAFAIECFERGALTKEDTNGLDLKWGDKEGIIALIKMMISRQGIGDVLADGVKKAAEIIGKDSEKYAVHAGGQELPMHDSRLDPGFALHYAVEATPGRHTIGSLVYYEMFQLWKKMPRLPKIKPIYLKNSKYRPDEEKAIQAAACSKYMNVLNGAGACAFGAMMGSNRFPIFEWLNEATGWNQSPEDYMEIGSRIQTLKHKFNIKHGLKSSGCDVHSRALGKPPQREGANRKRSVDLEQMIRDYRRQFNWDPHTGEPSATCNLLDISKSVGT